MADGAVKFGVGQPLLRREDDRFLRGAGRYVDDITEAGQAYAMVLRSPAAHARILSLDIAAARALPGVLAVLTDANLVAAGFQDIYGVAPVQNADGSAVADPGQPHLARGVVRYVGQPIAMVVAESQSIARDALELIEIDLDPLPAVADPRAALAPGAPELHASAPGNAAYRWEAGDAAAAEAAFRGAAHVIRRQIDAQRLVVNAIEPRAINIRYDASDQRWVLHSVSQGAFSMRGRIAAHLGVAPERLRVVTPDVGGGFGMKLMVHPEYAPVAHAARLLGRPVKWTADRSESFLSDAQARDLSAMAEAAFDADGRLLAMRFTGVSGLGAYLSQVGAAVHTVFSSLLLGGMYRIPAAHVAVTGAYANTPPSDAYRGAGRPEVINITERLMDAAAAEIGLDQAEIRRRNLLTAEQMPHKTWSGFTFDSGDCVKTLDLALSAADYAGAPERRAAAAARGMLWGVGVCFYMERTGGGPVENAKLTLNPDGTITVHIGTQSTGQGHETVWGQILHDKLGVDPARLVFPDGDSDTLPMGGGTGGSRSLIQAHRVLFLAADDLIEKARHAAADRLEAAIGDIEFSAAEGGVFRIAGTDRSIDLAALAGAIDAEGAATGEPALGLIGEGGVNDTTPTFPNGAHIAEVEIDPETGAARLARYTVADDFGRIVNPLTTAGQVHGGVAQGIGQALFETAVVDPETGQPLAGSYMDYQMPRAADFPAMTTLFMEDAPCATNPLGVKGCGEAGSVGAAPAVTIAVLDALRGIGAPEPQTPLTPHRIWAAIQQADRKDAKP